MPLRDHFRPPVLNRLPWETMHAAWVSQLATHLNERWLDDDYVALEESRPGDDTRIDIGTYEQAPNGLHGAVGTLTATYAPPVVRATASSVIPDHHEVRIFRQRGGRTLVAAIEILSPGNEDRPLARAGFVAKCVAYLQAGVSVAILDVVTECHFNLHNDLVMALQAPEDARLPPDCPLYAASYRPVLRGGQAEIDIWAAECVVGQDLPTMPLRLVADLFIPVEFEETYTTVCRQRKLR